MENSYASLQQELSLAQEYYPPRYFSAWDELKSWIRTNAISTSPIENYLLTSSQAYERALKIQEIALKDGYIISVAKGTHPEIEGQSKLVYLLANIDNNSIWWFPDRDELGYIR